MRTPPTITGAAVLAVSLAACSSSQAQPTASTRVSTASAASTTASASAAAASTRGPALGTGIKYPSGLEVTASKATPFTPSNGASVTSQQGGLKSH